jgi:hypothetical protein
MTEYCGDELGDAPHIQRSPAVLTDARRVEHIQELLNRFLDAMQRQFA